MMTPEQFSETALVRSIPHQPPMHLLDSATVDPDGRIIARRFIGIHHPFVSEGFLSPLALIEILSQAAACGAAAGQLDRAIHRGMLVSIRDVVFHRPVPVGDTLTITGRQERAIGPLSLWQLDAATDCGTVVEGRFGFHVEFSSVSGANL